MKKRIVSVILLVAALSALFCVNAFAETETMEVFASKRNTVRDYIDKLSISTANGTITVNLKELGNSKSYVLLLAGYDANNKMRECYTSAFSSSSEGGYKATLSNIKNEAVTVRKIFLISMSDGIAPFIAPMLWNGNSIGNGTDLPIQPITT